MAYKRRIYLINPRFQIKFSLLVCFIVFLCTLIYPMTINNIFETFKTYIISNQDFIPKAQEHLAALEQTKIDRIVNLIVIETVLISIVFICCIFFSHKIAGPLYKLEMFFKKIKDGQNPGKLFFRNGDYFQEIPDAFNESFAKVYDQQQQDFAYLSEIDAYLANLTMIIPDDKKIVLKEIQKKLNEIQNRFTDRES